MVIKYDGKLYLLDIDTILALHILIQLLNLQRGQLFIGVEKKIRLLNLIIGNWTSGLETNINMAWRRKLCVTEY